MIDTKPVVTSSLHSPALMARSLMAMRELLAGRRRNWLAAMRQEQQSDRRAAAEAE